MLFTEVDVTGVSTTVFVDGGVSATLTIDGGDGGPTTSEPNVPVVPAASVAAVASTSAGASTTPPFIVDATCGASGILHLVSFLSKSR
ncbi:hypothetical protein D3C78_1784660 [compost metagenome]